MRSARRSATAARMRSSRRTTAMSMREVGERRSDAGAKLVAINEPRLVDVDDRRLGKCGAFPFLDVGMREQRFKITAGNTAELHVVGAEPKRDRRVEAVGDRIAAAQIGAAGPEATARLLEDRAHTLDVRREAGRPRPYIDPLANAHRHFASQRRESGMHLGADRARPRTSARIVGPHLRMALGEMLRDRERIPDDRVPVMQARHEPRWQERVAARIRHQVVERYVNRFERLARQLRHEPATQRPRRIVPVADVELHDLGTVLPGLRMSFGSNARLTACISETASPCSATSASSLWTPMPCSPVHVPPMRIARALTRAASPSAFARASGFAGSNSTTRWKLPSPT